MAQRRGAAARRQGVTARGLALFLALAAAAVLARPAQASNCGEGLAQRVQGSGLTVAFSTQPMPIKVGQHFELTGVVCPASGLPLPNTLRVDADMPAHRHGMNYRASTELQADGRFSSRGLLLHMPGRWRFIFDMGATRLTHDLIVE